VSRACYTCDLWKGEQSLLHALKYTSPYRKFTGKIVTSSGGLLVPDGIIHPVVGDISKIFFIFFYFKMCKLLQVRFMYQENEREGIPRCHQNSEYYCKKTSQKNKKRTFLYKQY
jgi:hypothetical protein